MVEVCTLSFKEFLNRETVFLTYTNTKGKKVALKGCLGIKIKLRIAKIVKQVFIFYKFSIEVCCRC